MAGDEQRERRPRLADEESETRDRDVVASTRGDDGIGTRLAFRARVVCGKLY